MAPDMLCRAYLDALNAGDLDAVLALFAEDGKVVSPLYGVRDAKGFYADLFADTERSVTTPLNVFTSPGGAVALHFRYDWTLADGTPVDFEVVDVFELTEAGDRFAKCTIIYDTAPLRADFEAARVSR